MISGRFEWVSSCTGAHALLSHECGHELGAKTPPSYLQDAHYPGARKLGRGTGYEYPHELPEGVSAQPLLPDELTDRRYYEPTDRGFEAKLQERLAALRKRLRKRGE